MAKKRRSSIAEKPEVSQLLAWVDKAERTDLRTPQWELHIVQYVLLAILTAVVALSTTFALFHEPRLDRLEIAVMVFAPTVVAVLLYFVMRRIYNTARSELARFQLAVEYASDHIIITDVRGVILFANQAVERTTGYPADEIIGQNPRLWGHQMPRSFYRKMWYRLSIQKRPFIGEVTNKRKNGDLYIAECRIAPILGRDNSVKYYVGIERDITRAKGVDRAKTEFVSLASHQLRTPLSTVSWYTEMLMAGDAGKISEEQLAYLKEIYVANKRMTALVNDLLNVSRLEMGTLSVELEEVNPAKVADSVLKDLEELIKRNQQRVERKYAANVRPIQFDKKLLVMIFENLLTNATKYTPAGGKIKIALSLKREMIGRRKSPGLCLCIEVSDTGYGIPLPEQKQIFTKLFRATNVRERDAEGTGLGLYLVKQVTEVSGGTISFKSRENVGTSFQIMIPVDAAKKAETK